MLKSWLASLFILLLLGAAIYFDVFSWLAGNQARVFGLVLLGLVLAAAFLILGNPFKSR